MDYTDFLEIHIGYILQCNKLSQNLRLKAPIIYFLTIFLCQECECNLAGYF